MLTKHYAHLQDIPWGQQLSFFSFDANEQSKWVESNQINRFRAIIGLSHHTRMLLLCKQSIMSSATRQGRKEVHAQGTLTNLNIVQLTIFRHGSQSHVFAAMTCTALVLIGDTIDPRKKHLDSRTRSFREMLRNANAALAALLRGRSGPHNRSEA